MDEKTGNAALAVPGCKPPIDELQSAGGGGSTGERHHAFDLLRASMMLLGLVLHAACNYMALPAGPSWPFRDDANHPAFDVAVIFIHLFRMPVFFLMAGFFGALLCARRGTWGFAANRLKRVLLPLVLGWAVLFPLTVAGFSFTIFGKTAGLEAGLRIAVGRVMSGEFLKEPKLVHLWFLYVLLILYAFALLIRWAAGGLPASYRNAAASCTAQLLVRPWGPLVLGAATALTLMPMRFVGIDTVTSFLGPPRILVAYGFFFGIGWLFYGQGARVLELARGWTWRLGAGVTLAIVSVLLAGARSFPWRHAITGVAIWLIIFGLIGLFARFLNRPWPVGRYLADASYWIYLVHLPIVITLAGLLAHVTLPTLVKFAVVFGGTAAICVASYHLLVRSSPIGWLLNGRRYP